MIIVEDREAIEIYKELSKMNAKLTVDVASKLDKMTDNILQMNDQNILHNREVMVLLKLMSGKFYKLIIALIAVLALLALGEKAVEVFSRFVI